MNEAAFERALRELRRWGLLLVTDARLPSVAGLVAGEPIRGSWWGHAKAHRIVRVLMHLTERGDVVAVKLVSGKVTLVYRRLWPALFSIASARDTWQTKQLSRAARGLLNRLDRCGELRTDQLAPARSSKGRMAGKAARELEARLLVHAEEVHTESGAHAKRLESWTRWARRVGLAGEKLSVEQGKRKFEGLLAEWKETFKVEARLPWQAA